MNVMQVNEESRLRPVEGAAMQAHTVSTAVKVFTTFPLGTKAVLVSCDVAVRVRFDGTDPDASTGHLLAAGYSGVWDVVRAQKAKMIASSGDAKVWATPLTW